MFLTLGAYSNSIRLAASLINKYTQFKDTRGIMLFLNFIPHAVWSIVLVGLFYKLYTFKSKRTNALL